MNNPLLIQGGMGIGVSNWKLAQEVAREGQLGVISGVGLDIVLARKLQDGDPDGDYRRALAAFPFKRAAEKILNTYFQEGGIEHKHEYKPVPMFTIEPKQELLELTVAANFAETWLAKEGHNGLVGVNYLEKIQLPAMASLYGAMLAGADYVIFGAGVPVEIPGIIEKFVHNEPASLLLHVEDAGKENQFYTHFDPVTVFKADLHHMPQLKRPKFLPIVSSNILASVMATRSTGTVDGLIIEEYSAGGHNAPPRGKLTFNEFGEPLYSEKDLVNTDKLKQLGLPFWLAGSYGEPGRLQSAIERGAAGIQVGSAFALCKESGIFPELKQKILDMIKLGESKIFTDPQASPTGFPFKVLSLIDTLSEKATFLGRNKVCNMGYLRQMYMKEDKTIGYRCPAENRIAYVKKGGKLEDTLMKRCLCNALFATVGMPKKYANGYLEKSLVTLCSNLEMIKGLLAQRNSFSAKDVIDAILFGQTREA